MTNKKVREVKVVFKRLTKKEKFNMWWMIIFSSVFSFLCSIQMPAFSKAIMSAVSTRWISFQNFSCCLTAIIVCLIWDKKPKVKRWIMKRYPILVILSCIFSWCVDSTVFMNLDKSWHIYVLIIGNTIIFDVLFGEWFTRGYSLIKATLFEGKEERNEYDTKLDMYSCVANLAGFGVGMFVVIELNWALVFSLIGTGIWGLKHLVIFKVNEKKILDIKD